MNDEQATSDANEISEPREWLLSLMNHVEGQVAFGDTKASLLLAADSILLTAIGAVVTGEHPLADRLNDISRTFLALAFLGLVIALLFALYTIIPNRANLRHRSDTDLTPSPANFAWIASQESARYVEYALSMNTQELEKDFARVIHGKSTWARRKFQRLYLATVATAMGVAAAVVAILVELLNA